MVPKRFEIPAVSNVGATHDRVYDFWFLFSPDPDGIDLQQRELLCDGLCRSRSNENRHAMERSLPLQARGKIYAVSHHRVLKPQLRSHVANDATPGVDANADLDRHEASAGLGRFALTFGVQCVDTLNHVQRRLTGLVLLRW